MLDWVGFELAMFWQANLGGHRDRHSIFTVVFSP